MFTDLVNSTGLADGMDPEDFRVLIEAHRTIAVAPIKRYDGVVARYLGDGMLVLFGYPEAHEDDPERAVRAGLEVARATEAMNERWVGEGRGRIAVRIGVHTGIVVVGDVLKADVQELMAVFGNAPSIAARLQTLAKPNSVVLSGETKALLPSSILCVTRGNTTLKGLSRPIEVFAAIELREGLGDRRPAGRVLPFVNREKELATIRQHWAAAQDGQGRCLVIEGEPGIGKSRLIQAVRERLATQPSRWLAARTSPFATNTDFYAFSDLFRRVLQPERKSEADRHRVFDFAALSAALGQQDLTDPDVALGLANLLGIAIPAEMTSTPHPERLRELTLTAIARWIWREAERQPLVLVIEDLHWADASSREAIERLKGRLAEHPILLILTTRGGSMGYADSGKAKGAPEDDRPKTDDHTFVHLKNLRPASAKDLLAHVLQGIELPKAAVATLLRRANGVPLYLEELPKPALDLGGASGSTPILLPATLRDSLMAQLDRMGDAKMVAQTAAVLGHSFERPLLEHVWDGDADALEAGLVTLADAALITQEGGTPSMAYGFRHALLAEIAYDSLLRDDRRRLHEKTADTLVEHFRDLAQSRPEILARHHDSARNHEKAFACWMDAGRAAAKRSANAEALAHFADAEASLKRADIAALASRQAKQLALYLARAPVLISRLGWAAPEVESTYRAALQLSEQMELGLRDTFRIWGGLFNVYLLRGDLDNAQKTMEQGHKVAIEADDPEVLMFSHRGLGLSRLMAADYDQAIDHMDHVEALLIDHPAQEAIQTTNYGTNPRAIAFSVKAWCSWFKGEVGEAERCRSQAIEAAEAAGHPFSLCYALCLGASLSQFRGQVDEALGMAQRALAISEDQAFAYWRGWAMIVKGWALALTGDEEGGLAALRSGLDAYQSTQAAQMRGYGLSLLAHAYLHAGRHSEAIDAAEAAIAEMERTGIVFYKNDVLRLLDDARLAARGALDEGASSDPQGPPSD